MSKQGYFSLGKNNKRAFFVACVAVLLLSITLSFSWFSSLSQALVPSRPLGAPSAQVTQSTWRIYDKSSTTTPGAPLANDNTVPTLASPNSDFRIRLGLENKQFNLSIKQVSLGSDHTCAIASDDHVYCWGSNNRGQLGNNSYTDSVNPVAVDTSGALAGKTIKQLSVGLSYTCVIASDDKAYCWGDNNSGQLGVVNALDSKVPTPVDTSGALAGKTIKQISTGYSHACVIASDDKAYCWGFSQRGQLGNASANRVNLPIAVDTSGALAGKTIKQISAGQFHVCAIASDDQVYCWGDNNSGQLGTGDSTGSAVPVRLANNQAAVSMKKISSGVDHTCALGLNNNIYCWGDNNSGQLGNNSLNSSYTPVIVDTAGALAGKTISQISARGSHTCVVTTEGRAYCWGSNDNGQLGNNSLNESNSPVPVDINGALANKVIRQIDLGSGHTCVSTTEGKAYCWGNNNDGQLGIDLGDVSKVPVEVTQITAREKIIEPKSLKLYAQFAEKTGVATCGVVPEASWQTITSDSALSYSNNPPAHGLAISGYAHDPALSSGASGYAYQSIVRPEGGATAWFSNNSSIGINKVGLWDLILTGRALKGDTNYCVRLISDKAPSGDSKIDIYAAYPEFRTPASLTSSATNGSGEHSDKPSALGALANTGTNVFVVMAASIALIVAAVLVLFFAKKRSK